MKFTEYLLSQLEREAERCRRALEQFPEGQHAWKPHDRSLELGYVAMMVATIPNWIVMEIQLDELDIAPKDQAKQKPEPMTASAQYLTALDGAVAAARDALRQTTDEHLATPWRLLSGGTLAQEAPRHVMIQDTFNHLSHHRGQMTVYLRLLGARVPALFGPSADDRRF